MLSTSLKSQVPFLGFRRVDSQAVLLVQLQADLWCCRLGGFTGTHCYCRQRHNSTAGDLLFCRLCLCTPPFLDRYVVLRISCRPHDSRAVVIIPTSFCCGLWAGSMPTQALILPNAFSAFGTFLLRHSFCLCRSTGRRGGTVVDISVYIGM